MLTHIGTPTWVKCHWDWSPRNAFASKFWIWILISIRIASLDFSILLLIVTAFCFWFRLRFAPAPRTRGAGSSMMTWFFLASCLLALTSNCRDPTGFSCSISRLRLHALGYESGAWRRSCVPEPGLFVTSNVSFINQWCHFSIFHFFILVLMPIASRWRIGQRFVCSPVGEGWNKVWYDMLF